MTATRKRAGTGWSYTLDGEACPSVTTIIKEGFAKPAIHRSEVTKTAQYAVDHWDELRVLDEAARFERLKGAVSAEWRAGAVRGTKIHELAAWISLGAEVEVGPELRAHVDSYLRLVEDWEIEDYLVETPIGSRTFRYMGTFDLFAHVPALGDTLIDFKTSASGIFEEAALQLAAYRYAEFYLDSDGEERPMFAVDATAAAWIRADGYDLVPVETSPDVFRSFAAVRRVAEFRTERAEPVIRPALVASAGGAA